MDTIVRTSLSEVKTDHQNISIQILKWEKYNPRSDIKNSSWFRLEHSIFENPDYFDFTPVELMFWIYLLTLASKKNSGTFNLNLKHAERIGRFELSTIWKTLEMLETLGVIEVTVADTSTLRTSYAQVTLTVATDGTDVKKRDEKKRDEASLLVEKEEELPDLALFWNQFSNPELPRVRAIAKNGIREKATRARWKEKPDKAYWLSVIYKINSVPFLLGKGDKGWKIDFDFLIKPDSAIKILEGKYDNLVSGNEYKSKEQTILDYNDKVIERYIEKEAGYIS